MYVDDHKCSEERSQHAGSILGGGAVANNKRGELAETLERLLTIQKRLSGHCGHLHGMADRVLGPDQRNETICGAPSRPDGEIYAIHSALDEIERLVASSEHEAARFSRL